MDRQRRDGPPSSTLLLAAIVALALVVLLGGVLATQPLKRPVAVGPRSPAATPTASATQAPSPSASAGASPASPTPAPTPTPTPGPETLVGAGDIASCALDSDEATARLVEAIPGTVFTAGDNAYERGTAAEFAQCYDPTWGRFRERTRPAPGNHDYGTPGAAGYFEYFGAAAGTPGAGWYAFDLGAWRAYSLDSNCGSIGGCGTGSPQLEWLRADIAQHAPRCIVAYWHHPLVSSSRNRGNRVVVQLWRTLVDAGAEIVVNGHEHQYERFARLDARARPDPAGTRLFVVGTGGASLRSFRRPFANGSEVRDAETFGVLELTLAADGYSWRFHPAGGTVEDAGSDTSS